MLKKLITPITTEEIYKNLYIFLYECSKLNYMLDIYCHDIYDIINADI